MKGCIVGVLVFLALIAGAVLFVYPFVFDTISGLFENSDLGTIAGLVVCVLISGLILSISIAVAGLAGVTTQAVDDQRRAERLRKNLRNRR